MVLVDPPVSQERVEELLQKLFDLHDLKANGVLEEELRSWEAGWKDKGSGQHGPVKIAIIRDLYRPLKWHFITVLETFSIIKFATTLQRSFVLEVAERDPAIFKWYSDASFWRMLNDIFLDYLWIYCNSLNKSEIVIPDNFINVKHQLMLGWKRLLCDQLYILPHKCQEELIKMNEKVADAGGFPGISGRCWSKWLTPTGGYGDMKLNHETCGFNHDIIMIIMLNPAKYGEGYITHENRE